MERQVLVVFDLGLDERAGGVLAGWLKRREDGSMRLVIYCRGGREERDEDEGCLDELHGY